MKPAFPVIASHTVYSNGMTLREYYAGQMMAARMSNPELDERASAEDFADDAIKCADALIAALNKEGGK